MFGTDLRFWGCEMRIMVEKLLNQHGMEVLVEDKTVRGIFQPVTGRLERLALQDPGPLGLQSRRRYLYIGPLEPEVRMDMALNVAGKRYTVRTVHQINGDNGPVYTWAMCVEKGRESDEL